MNETLTQENMLEDFNHELHYEDASTGQRFINFIIDQVVFIVVIVVMILCISFTIEDEMAVIEAIEHLPPVVDRLASLIIYGIYMAITEGIFKGKTVGKLITGTKAVRKNGDAISWKDAFFRGLVRIIPFEPLSALGIKPWHDRWTNTTVIRIRN